MNQFYKNFHLPCRVISPINLCISKYIRNTFMFHSLGRHWYYHLFKNNATSSICILKILTANSVTEFNMDVCDSVSVWQFMWHEPYACAMFNECHSVAFSKRLVFCSIVKYTYRLKIMIKIKYIPVPLVSLHIYGTERQGDCLK